MVETLTFILTFLNILALIVLVHVLIGFSICVIKGKPFTMSKSYKWTVAVSLAFVITSYQIF
jgi:hypothetical protein